MIAMSQVQVPSVSNDQEEVNSSMTAAADHTLTYTADSQN